MSGSARLMAKGSRFLLMAEAVEELWTTKFCATIVPVSCVSSNIDLTKPKLSVYCFKNLDPREFFNSLSQVRTNGTAILRVRTWGYSWRKPEKAVGRI